jgi:hypothetical protein
VADLASSRQVLFMQLMRALRARRRLNRLQRIA